MHAQNRDGIPRWAPVKLKHINHRNTASSLLLHRANLAKLWWFCFPYLMPFSCLWDFIYKIRNCYWEKQIARLLSGRKKRIVFTFSSSISFCRILSFWTICLLCESNLDSISCFASSTLQIISDLKSLFLLVKSCKQRKEWSSKSRKPSCSQIDWTDSHQALQNAPVEAWLVN